MARSDHGVQPISNPARLGGFFKRCTATTAPPRGVPRTPSPPIPLSRFGYRPAFILQERWHTLSRRHRAPLTSPAACPNRGLSCSGTLSLFTHKVITRPNSTVFLDSLYGEGCRKLPRPIRFRNRVTDSMGDGMRQLTQTRLRLNSSPCKGFAFCIAICPPDVLSFSYGGHASLTVPLAGLKVIAS